MEYCRVKAPWQPSRGFHAPIDSQLPDHLFPSIYCSGTDDIGRLVTVHLHQIKSFLAVSTTMAYRIIRTLVKKYLSQVPQAFAARVLLHIAGLENLVVGF